MSNIPTVLIGWSFAISLSLFVATLVAVPILVVKMPADYFFRARKAADGGHGRHPLVRIAGLIVKNLAGAVLVTAGIAMLVLPGQGILTILIGLTLLNFPRKRALELLIVRQRPVRWMIDKIRAKAHRPPLELPPADRRLKGT